MLLVSKWHPAHVGEETKLWIFGASWQTEAGLQNNTQPVHAEMHTKKKITACGWQSACHFPTAVLRGTLKLRVHIWPPLRPAVSLDEVLPSTEECHFSYQIPPPTLKSSMYFCNLEERAHVGQRQEDSPTQHVFMVRC